MSAPLVAVLALTMVATAFLSGVFGMAGGLVLVGILLALLPLPEAMALHAVTQLASNVWCAGLWARHIQWRAVWPYATGSVAALVAWSFSRYVPAKPVALLLLGTTPFIVRLLPADLKPNPFSPRQGFCYGAVSMALLLLTGVSGPLVDTFFLGGALDRRAIVASKSACQVVGHAAKLVYFGGLIDAAATLDPLLAALAVAASMLGTTLARRLLEGLTDHQFRQWANRLITVIAWVFIVQGALLLVM